MTDAVWFLTELFYPDQTSTGYILTRIAEHVARERAVTVMCGPERYNAMPLAAAAKLDPRVVVQRVRVGNWNKNRIAARIIRSTLVTLKLCARLLQRAAPGQTVVVVTNPATLLLVVAYICPWRRLRLVVIVHDVFPENLVAAGILKEHSMFYRVLRRLSHHAYASADQIVVLGRDMQEMVRAKTGAERAERITIIENWAETQTIYPRSRISDGPLRLQFAGNLGRVQGLLRLLEAVRRAHNPNVEVDFLGAGALCADMRAFVERHELRQVRVLPPFARERQLEVLNDCDIGVVSLSAGMLGLGVPSKAYNYLAAGKPILYVGDSRSEIAQMVTESGVGWVFADFGDALVDFLGRCDPSVRSQLIPMGKRARRLAETRYPEARQLDAYRAVIHGT